MVKIKVQAVEPDTCDPPGCRYLELWDADVDPLLRTHQVAAFERVCPAHQTEIPQGKLLWWDGNWKDLDAYIAYQRAWFRRLNHVEWLSIHPGEAMPPQIADYRDDPLTPGSIEPPPVAERDGLLRAYGWNQAHNQRKNLALSAMENESATKVDRGRVSWRWEGHGDARTLTLHSGGQLTAQERARVKAALDIQFGPGACLFSEQ